MKMKLIIDLDESTYLRLYNKNADFYDILKVVIAIKNGTPLPKGHGRLIDADTLEESKEIMETIMNGYKYAVRMNEIRNAPTVVEADAGGEK